MFQLRPQQEARLKEGARTAFLGRVERHLNDRHSKIVEDFDPAQLRQFVERHWEASRTYGLVSEEALCGYLDAVCKLGEDFAEKFEWAKPLLTNAEYAEKKASRLAEKVHESNGAAS